MKLQGQHVTGIHFDEDSAQLSILDQTLLPFKVEWITLSTLEDACRAISTMQVRGAPAIGAVAAYGMVLASKVGGLPLERAAKQLKATRPTAVNLAWAVDRMLGAMTNAAPDDSYKVGCVEAAGIVSEDIENCSAIGDAGLEIIEGIWQKKGKQIVNILTHCNAGWFATVDWGTALAPIYKAQEKGVDVHVWVDETRPRNQGALLTSFELKEQGVPHTLVTDNAGGLLMQEGKVDLCIVGSDRTTANGDVCNKIGTYLKALAAHDNGVPFYVALPVSTIDWQLTSGKQIPIEYRDESEVLTVTGRDKANHPQTIHVAVEGVKALNPAFDVTPARYVTGLITEHGIFPASIEGLDRLRSKVQDSGKGVIA